jgi:alanyl-tRNA synthetase
VPGRDLRSLADDLKRRIGSGIVTVVSRAEGKAAIVVGVTPDLTDRFDAVELVRVGAAALGGKGGGGRPDMAQAGGPDAEQAEAALAAVEQVWLSALAWHRRYTDSCSGATPIRANSPQRIPKIT